jgi:hypothetical protein
VPDLVRRSRAKLDLLDPEDRAPAWLVPEDLGEQPFRLPAGREELDHAVDLIAPTSSNVRREDTTSSPLRS